MNDEQFVKDYAPVLIFSKGEQFFPMAVEPYIAQCSLHLREDDDQEKMLIPPGCIPIQWLGDPALRNKNLFLVYKDRRNITQENLDALAALWSLIPGPALREEAAPPPMMPPPAVPWAAAPPPPAPLAKPSITEQVVDWLKTLAGWIKKIPQAIGALIGAILRGTLRALYRRGALKMFKKSVGPTAYPDNVYARVQAEYGHYRQANPPLTYYYHVLHNVPDAEGGGHYAHVVQYWYFYAFNPHINRHEADWEWVTLFFREENSPPERAFYSAHEGGNHYTWEQLDKVTIVNGQKETVHPVVCVAKDSHANYRSPQAVEDESQVLAGEKNMPKDEFIAGGDLFSPDPQARYCWTQAKNLLNESWLDFPGKWGTCVAHTGVRLPDQPASQLRRMGEQMKRALKTITGGLVETLTGLDVHIVTKTLGGPPDGPKQHTGWDNPTIL